jgi:16S rRNA (cytosine1402-N4)-methyltransferase
MMMSNKVYHTPVLFQESIKGLELKENSRIVDVTYGGGGHSEEILKHLGSEGVLVAFDQDEDALENLIEDDRLIFVDSNFRFLYNFIKFHDLLGVDGLLADLGVSSHQFDVGERGFSIREEGKLDMRMNQKGALTAQKVVNDYPEKELFRVFNSFTDLQNVKKVVFTITGERKKNKINTTKQLVEILENLVLPKKKNQFLAQVFQAIRIEVNDEMGALMDLLEQTIKVIKPGGRLVVISYHSIEDRLVKNFIRAGNFEGKVETDVFGVASLPFKGVTRKPIIPSLEEIEENPRARSAKMRIAVRT